MALIKNCKSHSQTGAPHQEQSQRDPTMLESSPLMTMDRNYQQNPIQIVSTIETSNDKRDGINTDKTPKIWWTILVYNDVWAVN